MGRGAIISLVVFIIVGCLLAIYAGLVIGEYASF